MAKGARAAGGDGMEEGRLLGAEQGGGGEDQGRTEQGSLLKNGLLKLKLDVPTWIGRAQAVEFLARRLQPAVVLCVVDLHAGPVDRTLGGLDPKHGSFLNPSREVTN